MNEKLKESCPRIPAAVTASWESFHYSPSTEQLQDLSLDTKTSPLSLSPVVFVYGQTCSNTHIKMGNVQKRITNILGNSFFDMDSPLFFPISAEIISQLTEK